MSVGRRRRRITSQEHESVAGRLLALSLFIMLLAFFIVLTALSSYEETRVAPIFQSLEEAFAADFRDKTESKSSVTGRNESAHGEGTTVERLESLFTAIIPARNIASNMYEGTLHISMTIEEFEHSITLLSLDSDFEGKQKEAVNSFILPTLIALLRADHKGAPYHMDIVYNVEENPAFLANETPEKTALDMKRVAAYGRRIEQAGLPQKYMTVGLKKGTPGMIDLFFRPYIPFNPLSHVIEVEKDGAQ